MRTIILILFLLNNTFAYSQIWLPLNSPTTNNLIACSFVNENTGWIISEAEIFKTTDGGTSWNMQLYPPAPQYTTRKFTSVDFINENNGVIACKNVFSSGYNSDSVSTLLITKNGGDTWDFKFFGDTINTSISDTKMENDSTIYLINTANASIIKIINNNYSIIRSGYSGVTGVKLFILNHNTLYALYWEPLIETVPALLVTSDGGNTWDFYQWDFVSDNFYSMYIIDNNKFRFGCGFSGIYCTDDLLNTHYWANISSEGNGHISGLYFTDENNGWALSNNFYSAPQRGKIIYSTNSGVDWSLNYSDTIPLNAIYFTKPNNIGYAVGNNGLILRYSPVGINENNYSRNIQVYPNSNKGIFTICLSDNSEKTNSIEIYNTLGNKIYQTNFETNTKLINPT